MTRIKLIAILVGILVFISGSGLVYFAHQSQGKSKQIEEQIKEIEDQFKKIELKTKKIESQSKQIKTLSHDLESVEPRREEVTEEIEEIKGEYTALLTKFEAVKMDRDNVMIQTKRLISKKNEYLDIEISLQKLKEEKEFLLQEHRKAIEQIGKHEEELEELHRAQLEIENERKYFEEEYEKAMTGELIVGLMNKISGMETENKETTSALKKEKEALNKNLKETQKELSRVRKNEEKVEAEIEEREYELSELKSKYKDVVVENKVLERDLKHLPRKFSEIARQNKKLITETSEMHYNLGVMHTGHRDYNRAVKEFKKVVEINPEDAHAHFNLGYIYAEYLVDRDKAMEHFTRFLRLAQEGDKDLDWVKKYLLIWEAYRGTATMK